MSGAARGLGAALERLTRPVSVRFAYSTTGSVRFAYSTTGSVRFAYSTTEVAPLVIG